MSPHDDELYQSELRAFNATHRNRYTITLPPLRVSGDDSGRLIEVFPDDRPKRKIVDTFGRYLFREQHYDFPLSMEGCEKGYLFNCDAFLAITMVHPVGAAVFDKRKDGKSELAWVWIHPYFRRKGILTMAWPDFKREFGDFALQHPLSPAMWAFIRKITTPGIKAIR